MGFIADAMLGRLARWLRLMGYDVLYGDFEDDEIIAGAKGRTVLTRDRELARKAGRAGITVILMRSTDIKDQLQQLINGGEIKLRDGPVLSRCPLCNGEVEEVDRRMVQETVPHGALEHAKFWACEKCEKVYWEGRHWKNIKERVSEIKKGVKDVQNPDG